VTTFERWRRADGGCSDPGSEPVQYELNSINVVSETIEGEVLAIRSDNGAYYSMRGPTATVWVALVSGALLDDIVPAVAEHHQADLGSTRTDIEAFAASLVNELLIVEDAVATTTSVVGELPAETRAAPWETLAFERYNDMRDLLLFDPIHEVQVGGWPSVAPEPG
jgi:hypothetical protein